MPYYISGEVSEEDIVFNSAQDLKEKYDLEIYLKISRKKSNSSF